MKVQLYGINNCSSIRKTKVFLAENKIQFDFIDYKQQNPTEELLKNFFSHFNWQDVINKKGLTWRKLSTQQRENLTESKALELLLQYPTMIKRPIIAVDNKFYMGMEDLAKILS